MCGELDIPVESFLPHIRKEHRPKPQTVPSGYYGCLSGAEFWWPLGPMKGPCKWRCSVCGEVKWYWGKGNTHGGPDNRLADRRYGLEYCNKGRYPDHKRYLGKVDGAAGPVIFMHEGAPNPEQPVQDDPSLAPFIKETKKSAKSVSNKANKKGRGQRSDRATRQPKRTEQRARRVVRSN